MKMSEQEIEDTIQEVRAKMDLLSANGFYTSAVIAAAEGGIFRVFKGSADRAHTPGTPSIAGQDQVFLH